MVYVFLILHFLLLIVLYQNTSNIQSIQILKKVFCICFVRLWENITSKFYSSYLVNVSLSFKKSKIKEVYKVGSGENSCDVLASLKTLKKWRGGTIFFKGGVGKWFLFAILLCFFHVSMNSLRYRNFKVQNSSSKVEKC